MSDELLLLNDLLQICGCDAAAFGTVSHEIDAVHHAYCADAHAEIVGDKPAAFLTLIFFIFGVDCQYSIGCKIVSPDDWYSFYIALVAEKFSRLGIVAIGNIY